MHSYKLYLVSCLCLSYSLCSASSDFDDNLTRRHYMYPDGKTGTLTMNGGAQHLFRQQPALLASMLNSMEEEVVNHAHARRNNHSPENSARSSERNQTRAQATNVYTNYAPDYRYTGVGRTESVWPQSPTAIESITQSTEESPHSTRFLTDETDCLPACLEPAMHAYQESIRTRKSAPIINSVMSAHSIKRRKTTRQFLPHESSDSDDEHSSDNAAQECKFQSSLIRDEGCAQRPGAYIASIFKTEETLFQEVLQMRKQAAARSVSSADSDDDSDTLNPLPYKTKDLSKATCWRCCTHLVRSCLSKFKEN